VEAKLDEVLHRIDSEAGAALIAKLDREFYRQ